MTNDKILLLKKAASLPNGLEFKSTTEFHIVMGVVYMQGFPVPMGLQKMLMAWIEDNPKLFTEIKR